MYEWSEWGHGFGHWGFGILFWVLLIVVLVVLVMNVNKGMGGNGRDRTDKSALDILKERYARGEIDKDEFEQKKKDLQS